MWGSGIHLISALQQSRASWLEQTCHLSGIAQQLSSDVWLVSWQPVRPERRSGRDSSAGGAPTAPGSCGAGAGVLPSLGAPPDTTACMWPKHLLWWQRRWSCSLLVYSSTGFSEIFTLNYQCFWHWWHLDICLGSKVRSCFQFPTFVGSLKLVQWMQVIQWWDF